MIEKIKIITDSTTSLSNDECEKLDIICLETTYTLDSKFHFAFDEEETSLPTFYEKLNKANQFSTGCVNMNTFEECFENLIKEGYKILYLGLSASLSSTFNNAKIVSDKLNDKYKENIVSVVDTKCASYGSLLLIERAKELIEQGNTLTDIEKILNDEVSTMSVAFVSPDLSFMFKSGRLNALELGIGKILRIVPIIYVSESGKLCGKNKCIGMKLALKKLKSEFVSFINNKKHKKCYITSCNMPEEVDNIKQYIAENTQININDIKTGLIDKTLSCCCGPKTVAIFCL